MRQQVRSATPAKTIVLKPKTRLSSGCLGRVSLTRPANERRFRLQGSYR
jgi:hypothetical protein